jgi:hypothetical protein
LFEVHCSMDEVYDQLYSMLLFRHIRNEDEVLTIEETRLIDVFIYIYR